MKTSYLGLKAISKADFSSFITAMWMRNHNLCTPPTEGALLGKMYDTRAFNVKHELQNDSDINRRQRTSMDVNGRKWRREQSIKGFNL